MTRLLVIGLVVAIVGLVALCWWLSLSRLYVRPRRRGTYGREWGP